MSEQIEKAIICAPIAISIPATAGFALEKKESQTASYAASKTHGFQLKHFSSTEINCIRYMKITTVHMRAVVLLEKV